MLEQGAQRNLAAEERAEAADQPSGEQRVAAEIEEVVVNAEFVAFVIDSLLDSC